MEQDKGPIYTKSFTFALSVIASYKMLIIEKEFVISKQLLRSGTAIGALVREARYAESKPDFIHKMSIALKEANKTRYWIDLIAQSGFSSFVSKDFLVNLSNEVNELIKILTSIVRSSKESINKL